MNLILDLGNTLYKLALFHNKTLSDVREYNHHHLDEMIAFLQDSDFEHVIVSSVVETPIELIQALEKKTKKIIKLDHTTKLPIKLDYDTKESLGKDRIALAVGGFLKFLEKNILIIDAGTCITFDFVDQYGIYRGGAISPGLSMRYRALHTFTAKLPLEQAVKEHIAITGKSTSDSIRSGVQNGIVFEIEGAINYYQNRYNDLKIILCGGDTNYLANKLKSLTFAQLNFMLYGLNEILLFNA